MFVTSPLTLGSTAGALVSVMLVDTAGDSVAHGIFRHAPRITT